MRVEPKKHNHQPNPEIAVINIFLKQLQNISAICTACASIGGHENTLTCN